MNRMMIVPTGVGYRSAKRWRLYIISSGGGTNPSFLVPQLQFRTTAGVPLYATGGVASASSILGSTNNAEAAFTQFLSQVWGSHVSDLGPCWLEYAFPEALKVVQVAFGSSPTAGFLTKMPRVFKVQAYLSGGWVDVTPVITASTWAVSQEKVFPIEKG